MINTRRPNPRLSLDDLVDALIENPSYDDTQLIGDVRADNARSSKMVKGQAEFLELNAWIDNHNELPSFDSSDFKENQLARRMNGYALNSAEHEDLKPFDKHGLINASLYQEIAAKPDLLSDADDFAAPFEFSSSNSDDISADYGASNLEVVAGTPDFDILDNHEAIITAATKESSFIDDISAEDVAWLDSIEINTSQEVIDAQTQSLLSGIDELPRFDVVEPLSSISRPAISAAAAAIIKLRASRKLLEAKAQVDTDIDSALLMDDFDYQPPVAPLDTQPADVFGSIANTTTQAQAQAQPQSQNQLVFDAETNVLGLHEALAEPESIDTASIDIAEYPLIYMPAFFGVKEESSYTPELVELEPAHEIEVAVESIVVGVAEPKSEPVKAVKEVQRIINPSYMNILYQSTPDAKSYDDITYVRKHTPYVFDETPADDIDELQMAFSDIPLVDQLPANYHENLIDYYSITGISEDDLSLDDNNTLDTALPATGATEESVAMVAAATSVNAKVNPEPTVSVIEVPSTPAISNEATVTDTTNTTKPKVDVYWSIDGEYDHSVVNSDYATGITQRHNPNPPMTNAIPAPRKRIGLNNGASASSGTGSSAASQSRPTLVSGSISNISDNKVLEPADRVTAPNSSSYTDLAGTPAAINLAAEAVSQPLESATPEFASLDDILADDDDFLSSLCLEEEHLFDIENKYTDPSDKATPDEVGKQTRCDDFFMYESHFNTLHAKLESGHLKTARYTATDLQVGDAFILNGVLGFIQSIGEYRENYAGVYDPRLRLIFDNGTESNILLLSLGKNLYADKTGRLVIRSADDFTDFDSPDDHKPAKIRTGQVYIVRSLSDNPTLKQVSDLYKIGFTKGSVEERTKNAVRDTAFLEAPIEVVATATCYDLDPRGLEGLIHKFLECQRINITLTSKKGGLYHPQEWFDIELSEAKKIISHIVDGTIINYRMDNTTNRLVAK